MDILPVSGVTVIQPNVGIRGILRIREACWGIKGKMSSLAQANIALVQNDFLFV